MITVKFVEPLKDFKINLMFDNDEEKIFDMTGYLYHGIFSGLKDVSIINSVKVAFDTIEWSNGADLCPEVLYSNSRNID